MSAVKAHRLVLIDGRFDAALSDPLSSNISLVPYEEGICIDLHQNAQAVIIEKLSRDHRVTHLKTILKLHENAQLSHYIYQDDHDQSTLDLMTHVIQKKNSECRIFLMNRAGISVKQFIHCELQEPRATFHLLGGYEGTGQQQLDFRTVIEHQASHCQSTQLFKSAVNDQARALFYGKIKVHKEAQKTNATLYNHNLLLSDESSVNTKPILEIDADDVQCAHGATVGFLDVDALFYLRSRGVEENEARALLIQAFLSEVSVSESESVTNDNL